MVPRVLNNKLGIEFDSSHCGCCKYFNMHIVSVYISLKAIFIVQGQQMQAEHRQMSVINHLLVGAERNQWLFRHIHRNIHTKEVSVINVRYVLAQKLPC